MHAPARPLLILREPRGSRQQWAIEKPEVILGRSEECDVQLPGRAVSRRHAQILQTDRGYLLTDLGSKNGTFVNGKEVRGEPYRLKDGDELQIALYIKMGFVGADATVPLELTGPYKGLRVDKPAKKVFLGDQELSPPLSAAQYRLLELLSEREGHVVTRDEIVSVVWSEQDALGVTEQAIDALVHRLRDRIAALDPDHEYIVTVRGHGLRLENR